MPTLHLASCCREELVCEMVLWRRLPAKGDCRGKQWAQVRPLRRQLKGLKAWITGQRKDQSPGTRDAVPVVQVPFCACPPPPPPPGPSLVYLTISPVDNRPKYTHVKVANGTWQACKLASTLPSAGSVAGRGGGDAGGPRVRGPVGGRRQPGQIQPAVQHVVGGDLALPARHGAAPCLPAGCDHWGAQLLHCCHPHRNRAAPAVLPGNDHAAS